MSSSKQKGEEKSRLETMIKNLKLEADKKEILQLVWLDYFTFTDKKASKNWFGFDKLQLVIIITGVLIPVLEGTGLDEMVKSGIGIEFNIGLISLLGLVVAIAAGVNRHYAFEEKWRHYRQNAELMRNEGEDYFALSNRYRRFKTHEDAFSTFMAFVTNFKRNELQAYMAGTEDKDSQSESENEPH